MHKEERQRIDKIRAINNYMEVATMEDLNDIINRIVPKTQEEIGKSVMEDIKNYAKYSR
jgi:hypothetical protein